MQTRHRRVISDMAKITSAKLHIYFIHIYILIHIYISYIIGQLMYYQVYYLDQNTVFWFCKYIFGQHRKCYAYICQEYEAFPRQQDFTKISFASQSLQSSKKCFTVSIGWPHLQAGVIESPMGCKWQLRNDLLCLSCVCRVPQLKCLNLEVYKFRSV